MKVEAFRARPDDETWRESLQARRKGGEKKTSKLKEKAKKKVSWMRGEERRTGGQSPDMKTQGEIIIT